jgi:hypothetical protein
VFLVSVTIQYPADVPSVASWHMQSKYLLLLSLEKKFTDHCSEIQNLL